MIANILQRSNCKRVVDYIKDVMDSGKKSKLLMHSDGIIVSDNRTITACFEAYTRKGGHKIKDPLLHIQIAFHEKDESKLTDEVMKAIVEEYMKRMGYKNVEYIVCRHFDTHHPHCHLLICTIDNDGNKINRSFEKSRNKRICEALTKKYGLHVAEPGKKEVNRAALREPDKSRYEIFDKVTEAKNKCEDWKEFDDMLKSMGIKMRFVHNNVNGNLMGVNFSNDKYTFSGKKLDDSLVLSELIKKFGNIREIVHESMHQCYDNYQHRLQELNGGSFKYFAMLRYFPEWDKIFPNGLPKCFKVPSVDIHEAFPESEHKGFWEDVVDSEDGKKSFIGLDALWYILMQPYQPQIAISGGGGTTSNLPWRDLDDDERWKYRFAVTPAVYPKYIKPRYMKSKSISSKPVQSKPAVNRGRRK